MRVDKQEFEDQLILLAKKVVSDEEASYFAKEIVECHIRKAPRTLPVKDALSDLVACLKHRNKKIEYTVDLPAYVSVNFNGHGILPYLKRIHDDIELRSSKTGIAMFSFINSQSMHTLHTWVQGLAKRGLVAIAICNGGPGAVVPFNGTKGVFGTNPMAYGLPGIDGQIHCVDMATSEIPYFEIMDAHKNKQPLQGRSAVDQLGEYTSDASKALDFSASDTDPISNIVPMGGGYKGYYLVYLLEMLTSGLINMPSSPEMSDDFIPEEHGSTVIVFNPFAMKSEGALAKSIASVNEAIKKQPPKDGQTIRLPGEENSRRLLNQSKFIEIDDNLMEQIINLATNES